METFTIDSDSSSDDDQFTPTEDPLSDPLAVRNENNTGDNEKVRVHDPGSSSTFEIIEIDDSSNSCPLCGRYIHPRNVHYHMKKYHSIKPQAREYHCTICNKKISKRSAIYHMKYRHSEEREYACPFCEKKLKTVKTVNRHIANMHSSNPKPKKTDFRCRKCDETFCSAHFLYKHVAGCKVLKESNKCNYCYEVFETKQQLTLHIGVLGKKMGKCRNTLKS